MVTKLPEAIRILAAELAELPSIGPRQAVRLAFYLIDRGPEHIANLAEAMANLQKVKICERCFFPTQWSGPRPDSGVGIVSNQISLCDVCRNPSRNQSLIMIIEKETDFISLENSKKFNGRYFIIGVMPKTGVLEDWQKLRLQNLKSFITKELSGKAEEIILAFNPTSAGDFNSSLIIKELAPLTKKISRLGIGLPSGGEIEFADDETLGGAIDKRS